MKKIVHVVEAFAGGVYSFLTNLCNLLTDEYEVVIVYSLREQTPRDFRKDFDTKIKFIKIDMCRGLNPCKDLKAFINLKKILKEEKPDVIHLHSSKAGFLGRAASYVNGFDMEKVFYNPHGFSFLQQNESKIKTTLYYILEKLASKFGGCIVGCSKGEYDEALKISNKCVNINNGIDIKKVDKIIAEDKLDEEDYKNNKTIRIGTVGRICYQKNPLLFNEIAKSFPQYDFAWIGDGELKHKLTSQNIKITGWINKKEVIKEVLKLNIFILPSLWEGLPIALLEAMYLSRPVIVSNVIGNNNVVVNGINGFISNDCESFTKYIDLLVKDSDKKNKFKLNAKECVLKSYSIDNMLNKYIDIYSNEIAKTGRKMCLSE